MLDRLAKLAGVAFLLGGCNSEAMPPAYVGVAGAGINAQIVHLGSQPDGYSLKVDATNRDTASLRAGAGCDWSVERQLDDKSWVTLYRRPVTPCYDSGALLAPGQLSETTFTIKSPELPTGTALRVVTSFYVTSSITT